MWQIQIPLVDMFKRLVELNEDRNTQYTAAIAVCTDPALRDNLEQMAGQSSDFIRQLKPYLMTSPLSPSSSVSYAVSPSHWERLRLGIEINDVFLIPVLIHLVEEEFSLLYANICQMLPVQHPAEGIVLNQYDSILRKKEVYSRYFFHYN